MYRYEDFREYVLSDEGQRALLETRDKAVRLLAASGAVVMSKVMPSGDSWKAMAVVDRLVEVGDLREVTTTQSHTAERIFVECGGVADLVNRVRTGRTR
jgi:hypothetical protein